MSMKTVVVNNPAARRGGALTILKEFLEKISLLECDRIFYVIVSVEELKKYDSKKIKIIVINFQGLKERILWDNFKLKKFLKNKKIFPKLFISLQNTGVNIDRKIPQILYFHQALSIANLNWSLLKKNERKYWEYENIYPIFIRIYLNRIKKVIVQTDWIRDIFSKKFNYSKSNIMVIRPKVKKININEIQRIKKEKYCIFYPAGSLIYKNHKVIVEALGELKK